jgi:hypothetical protein
MDGRSWYNARAGSSSRAYAAGTVFGVATISGLDPASPSMPPVHARPIGPIDGFAFVAFAAASKAERKIVFGLLAARNTYSVLLETCCSAIRLNKC